MPLQTPGERTIVVKAVDRADNFTSASTKITIKPLEPPVITDIPETLKFGENLIIKGTSLYPEATVRIFTQRRDETPTEKDVKINLEGNWVYDHGKVTKVGIHKVWAIVIDPRGAQSLPSEKITLTIAKPPVLGGLFGNNNNNNNNLLVIIILLVIIGILISIIFSQRRTYRAKKDFLQKETKEIEKSVIKTFRALREEVKERVSEKKTHDKLKEALDISEEFIKKEIEDVEKGLKP
jgi:cell division protein FtsL